VRVALVSPVGHQFGAFSRQCELARGLIASGADVVWFGPEVLKPVDGVQYIRIGGVDEVLSYTKLLCRLKQPLQKESPSVDVFVAFREYDVLLFSKWAARSNVPIVFFSRGDILANEFLNQVNRSGVRKGLGWIKITGYYTLRRVAVSRSDIMIVQAPQLEWQMRFVDPTISRQISILPNNSNPSWTNPGLRGSWRTMPRGTRKTIGYIGRVSPNRGLEDLVHMIGHLSSIFDAHLEVFGPEVNGDGVRQLVDSLRLTQMVVFRGPTATAQEEMRKMDVLVANRFVEGCPNVVLEAMGVGVPIVSTNIPAYRFLLGRKGVFYRPGDAFDLADMVRSLLSSPDRSIEYSNYLSGRGAMFEFDWSTAAARIVICAARREAVAVPVEVQRILGFDSCC